MIYQEALPIKTLYLIKLHKTELKAVKLQLPDDLGNDLLADVSISTFNNYNL